MGGTGSGLLTLLSSPWLFAGLVTLSVALISLSLMPSTSAKQVEDRLEGYVDRGDVIEQEEMEGSFGTRVLFPMLRGLVRWVGGVAPSRAAASTEQLLQEAGRPYGLTVLDFFGLRLIAVVVLGVAAFWLVGRTLPLNRQAVVTAVAALGGYFVPTLWLRTRMERRKKEISQALPDALDMLTIGVEAGLAFESALLRVGDRWDNALTREVQRAVSEMRVKRRQKAETLANQAATKLAFPLVFLIFPAMLVVLLGPAIPTLMDLAGIAGG